MNTFLIYTKLLFPFLYGFQSESSTNYNKCPNISSIQSITCSKTKHLFSTDVYRKNRTKIKNAIKNCIKCNKKIDFLDFLFFQKSSFLKDNNRKIATFFNLFDFYITEKKNWKNFLIVIVKLRLTLLLLGVITTAKKAQCNIFSVVKGWQKTKKLLKEPNVRVFHVHFTEEGFKVNLEVITLRTTTERYIM